MIKKLVYKYLEAMETAYRPLADALTRRDA